MSIPSDGVAVTLNARHERWRGHVAAQARGTLTQRAYCDAHALAYSSFTYWRRRLNAKAIDAGAAYAPSTTPVGAVAPTGSAFVPVTVRATPAVAATLIGPDGAAAALILVLPGGVRIENVTLSNADVAAALVRQL